MRDSSQPFLMESQKPHCYLINDWRVKLDTQKERRVGITAGGRVETPQVSSDSSSVVFLLL